MKLHNSLSDFSHLRGFLPFVSIHQKLSKMSPNS